MATEKHDSESTLISDETNNDAISKRIKVTPRQVEVAQSKVEADLSQGREPDRLVLAIANAGEDDKEVKGDVQEILARLKARRANDRPWSNRDGKDLDALLIDYARLSDPVALLSSVDLIEALATVHYTHRVASIGPEPGIFMAARCACNSLLTNDYDLAQHIGEVGSAVVLSALTKALNNRN